MHIQFRVLIVVLSLLAGHVVLWAQPRVRTASLDSLVTALEANNKAMGAITVRKNGQVIYNRAFGFYKLDGDKKLTPNSDTRYRIGSITKTFTAVMILQMIEEKKLQLTTPLATFFPNLPNAQQITIADLLTHKSGLHNFTDDPEYQTWMTQSRTRDQMLEMIAGQTPDFKPGEQEEYSNTNYVLLGYIIEKIAGATYGDELKRRIVDRIKLKNTYYGSTINPKRNEAASYAYTGGAWEEQPETDMSIPHGAGAIVSTTNDLTQFYEALFNHKLIRDSSLATMTTIKSRYGMGITQIPFYDRKAFGHNGGIDGFVSSAAYFPSDSISVAVTTNGLNYSLNNIMIGVLSSVFDKEYTIPTFTSVTLSPEILARYAGVYASTQIPIKITIAVDGDHLTGQATGQPPFPLEATSETKFTFDQAGVVFEFKSPDGKEYKQMVFRQGGREFEFTRE